MNMGSIMIISARSIYRKGDASFTTVRNLGTCNITQNFC